MHSLSLEGQERCPAGVKWTTRAAPGHPATGEPVDGYCYSSGETEPVTCQMRNLEQPVVIRFVNARFERSSHDGMAGFLGRYGFPTALPVSGLFRGFESKMRLKSLQKRQRRLLRIAGGVTPTLAVQIVNETLAHRKFDISSLYGISGPIAKPAQLRLLPKLEYPREPHDGETPRLVLAAESLFDYMTMECAFVAMVGARMAACKNCGDLYLTGPLTGRRSHSLYCSDKCRVAAMRKRQAAAVIA
jgi:hypothetical protein